MVASHFRMSVESLDVGAEFGEVEHGGEHFPLCLPAFTVTQQQAIAEPLPVEVVVVPLRDLRSALEYLLQPNTADGNHHQPPLPELEEVFASQSGLIGGAYHKVTHV